MDSGVWAAIAAWAALAASIVALVYARLQSSIAKSALDQARRASDLAQATFDRVDQPVYNIRCSYGGDKVVMRISVLSCAQPMVLAIRYTSSYVTQDGESPVWKKGVTDIFKQRVVSMNSTQRFAFAVPPEAIRGKVLIDLSASERSLGEMEEPPKDWAVSHNVSIPEFPIGGSVSDEARLLFFAGALGGRSGMTRQIVEWRQTDP